GSYGVKRYGQNVYDALSPDLNSNLKSPNGLAYDFDDGTKANNTLSAYGSRGQVSGGDAMTAPGDSGGPGFLVDRNGNFLIAGVTSYGTTKTSFGAIGVDERVSTQAPWVDRVAIPAY